jgi:hypothetical protein
MSRFFFVFYVLLFSGCDNTVSTTEPTRPIVHDELGILPKLISLPKQPISVKWQLDEYPEKNTGNLQALLEFSPQNKIFIIENSPEFDSKQNAILRIELFDAWLPEHAKDSIEVRVVDGIVGAYELSGVRGFKPDLFTRTDLSPYVNGYITPLSGGYILVSLYAM